MDQSLNEMLDKISFKGIDRKPACSIAQIKLKTPDGESEKIMKASYAHGVFNNSKRSRAR